METILIVNSDPQLLATMADAVWAIGHPVTSTDNAYHAMELLASKPADVVIVDLKMAETEWRHFVTQGREVLPRTSFIIVTGYGHEYSLDGIIEAGADDFIKKPFTADEFKAKLRRIVLQHRLSMENNRLLEQQAVLNERLAYLLAVASDLTAELEVDRLFQLIVGKVTEALGAERTSLYVIDWENKELWTKVAEQVHEIRLPLGEGISGRVALNGEIVNVPDAWLLPYFNRDFDKKHLFRTRSVLCVPIRNQPGDRIGVLQIINKRNGDVFTPDDETFTKGLAAQVGIALDNSLLYEEVRLSFDSSIQTLSATVDARHPLTAGHSQRVTQFSLLIAREMGLTSRDLEVLKYASLLHDIGKIGIPDAVLLKDGQFTPEEREMMKAHAVKTRTILENFHFPKALKTVPVVAAHHHEKYNGQGYPDGLQGEDSPLGSRIMAVADVFDALTSRRDYPKYNNGKIFTRDPMPMTTAIQIVEKEKGGHFDPQVIEAFHKCLPQLLKAMSKNDIPRDFEI